MRTTNFAATDYDYWQHSGMDIRAVLTQAQALEPPPQTPFSLAEYDRLTHYQRSDLQRQRALAYHHYDALVDYKRELAQQLESGDRAARHTARVINEDMPKYATMVERCYRVYAHIQAELEADQQQIEE